MNAPMSDDAAMIQAEVERAREYIRVAEGIIAERDRVLDALPCKAHGRCVPHALEEIARLKDVERSTWEAVGTEVNQVFHGGTRVTNCAVHMSLPLSNRPRACDLCATDIGNHLAYAIRVNGWLNERLEALRARATAQREKT